MGDGMNCVVVIFLPKEQRVDLKLLSSELEERIVEIRRFKKTTSFVTLVLEDATSARLVCESYKDYSGFVAKVVSFELSPWLMTQVRRCGRTRRSVLHRVLQKEFRNKF